MSAAAPVQDLFREPSRVSGSAGAFDGSAPPSLEPLKTPAPTPTPTAGHREGVIATDENKKEQEEEEGGTEGVDSLLRRYVDAAQELLVPAGELASVKELAFAFQRAASRLLEVRASWGFEMGG